MDWRFILIRHCDAILRRPAITVRGVHPPQVSS
jgi:hypothetical protein